MPFDQLLFFEHAILGFGYDEVDEVPMEYVIRMIGAFKQILTQLFKGAAADTTSPNVVIPDLPPLSEVFGR